MSAQHLDYIGIDMQHGLVDYSDLVPMLQALTLGSATPVVRIAENTTANISRALDAGALGVIVPMVSSKADAEAAVASCFYLPKGRRSYGPTRALAVEGPDYYSQANDTVACIPMIETAEALDGLDEILAIDSIECVYVGPSDLAISLGLEPGTDHPAFFEALDTIVEGCRRHDVVPGIHATPATAADRFQRGFRMVTIVADLHALRAGVATAIAQGKGETVELGDSIY